MDFLGQASTEQLILFAIALLLLIVALSLVVVWPGYVQSIESQESSRAWVLARPFSVGSHPMYPNQMVLELQNTEPVTLTVKSIYLDGVGLDFYNHSVPFTWASASPRCSGGVCTMVVLPGQAQIISTANFTDSPANPCVTPNGFAYGNHYKMDLAITYHASNSSSLESESSTAKLVGDCSAGSADTALSACGALPPGTKCCDFGGGNTAICDERSGCNAIFQNCEYVVSYVCEYGEAALGC